VTWDLSVRKIDDNRREITNHVTARATEPFLAFIKEHGISFEEAAAARQKASSLHNQGETPLFAKSIELTAHLHGFFVRAAVLQVNGDHGPLLNFAASSEPFVASPAL
jgi:hypothetical protein